MPPPYEAKQFEAPVSGGGKLSDGKVVNFHLYFVSTPSSWFTSTKHPGKFGPRLKYGVDVVDTRGLVGESWSDPLRSINATAVSYI